jgi:hypothetical protein
MRLKWKLHSLHLEIVLILTQERCTVWAERTSGSEIILDARMELLGDVGHVESLLSPFVDSVSVDARLVHGSRQTYHRLRTRWYT